MGRRLPDAIRGPAGLSAYEVWLAAGNTGSVADFLASLRGADGAPGRAGQQGPEGDVGPAGRDGAPGRPGSAGRDGIDGEPGASGRDGIDGARGAAGRDGVDGKPGVDGRAGVDGKPGAKGDPGIGFTLGVPTVQTFTSGQAFQPDTARPVMLSAVTTVAAIVGVSATLTLATSPTQGGTFVQVAADTGSITVVGLLPLALSVQYAIPAGHWAKLTVTSVGLGTPNTTAYKQALS